MNHLVVAMLSAIGGLAALGFAARSDEPIGLLGLLGIILLLNALIRFILARHHEPQSGEDQ